MWIDKACDPIYVSDSQRNHQRVKTHQKEHFLLANAVESSVFW